MTFLRSVNVHVNATLIKLYLIFWRRVKFMSYALDRDNVFAGEFSRENSEKV